MKIYSKKMLAFLCMVLISPQTMMGKELIAIADDTIFCLSMIWCSHAVRNLNVGSDQEALEAAMGFGVVAGMLSGGWLHRVLERDQPSPDCARKCQYKLLSAGFGIFGGAALGMSTYYLLKEQIQKDRLLKAEKTMERVKSTLVKTESLLTSIERDVLLFPEFVSDNDFLQFVKDVFGGYHFPVYSAAGHLFRIANALQEEDDLLVLVLSEVAPEDLEWLEKMRDRMSELLHVINARRDFLKQQPEYKEQLSHMQGGLGPEVELNRIKVTE